MKRKVVYFFLLLFMLVSCSQKQQKVIPLNVANQSFWVEIADDDRERQLGLMNRKSLEENHGMLFVFQESKPLSFWMRNTLIPLSIAFIDEAGIIIDIKDMVPLDESSVKSSAAVRYALEVNKGAFQRSGIVVGDKVDIPEEYR